VAEDGDCDGVLTADDCDDGDSDSTVVAEDGDCDGVLTADDCDDGDSDSTVVAEDGDCDGVLTADDCDDTSGDSTVVAEDGDCDGVLTADDCDDGYGDSTVVAEDGDCDGVVTADDCDDGDSDSTVVAEDGDCDGVVTADDCDDSDPTLNTADADDDGVSTCDGDCNDDDATVYPGAIDGYDLTDSDCDGLVDEDDISEGDVILNEAMVNPDSVLDADGEWFELHNASERDINLRGWVFSDDGTDALEVEEDLIIAAGGYLVFAANADEATNGGVSVDYPYAYEDMRLANTDDEFVITVGAAEIYGIAWSAADWPFAAGYAMGWDGEDDWALGWNWCAQRSMLDGGDYGTPGAANDGCDEYTATHGGTMIMIDAQMFEMGCTAGMSSCGSGESPAHDVTLTNDFYIGETEVTQGEYEAMMGTNPSSFTSCGSDCPVEMVSWHMSAAFTNAVSDSESLEQCYTCTGSGISTNCSIAVEPYSCGGYRLPTEAEWEAAARCGEDTLYAGSTVPGDVAWYSSGATYPVATKASNACGLYDMSGNLYEWIQDWHSSTYYSSSPGTNPVGATSGDYRVLRGGSWGSSSTYLRIAYRSSALPSSRNYYKGLRLLRTSP
jgi:formylglycine-generating enzyme required for sulfatase activity